MMRRWLLAFVLFVAAGAALAGSAPVLTIYHEADCPSVDVTRMKRMKRAAAETMGLVPAADCHPDARVRYLGVGPAGYAPSQVDVADAKTVRVRSHTRSDGTVVDEHWRRPPNR